MASILAYRSPSVAGSLSSPLSASSWVSDDVRAVADLACEFFAQHVVPAGEQSLSAGYPDRKLYETAGEMGLLCMSVPEGFGGGGGTFAHDFALLTEQVKAGDSSLHLGVHSVIVPHYILAYGSEEQKLRYLPKLASGEWIGAIAMTEPGAGSDLQAMSARAVATHTGYALTGTK